MKYKALVCDIDGTLIQSKVDGMPSKKVIKTIRAINSSIPVSVATSRAYDHALPIVQAAYVNGPSIFYGGARLINPKTNTILQEYIISPETTQKVMDVFQKARIKFLIDDDIDQVRFTKGFIPRIPLTITTDYFTGISHKRAELLLDRLSGIPDIAITKVPAFTKNRVSVLATHAHATKQHGILEIAKRLGIQTHEIIGIGDSYNDFPLLMACGLKVAMGNAVPELKAIADYIAPTVEDDGVAEVIEKFLLSP